MNFSGLINAFVPRATHSNLSLLKSYQISVKIFKIEDAFYETTCDNSTFRYIMVRADNT